MQTTPSNLLPASLLLQNIQGRNHHKMGLYFTTKPTLALIMRTIITMLYKDDDVNASY